MGIRCNNEKDLNVLIINQLHDMLDLRFNVFASMGSYEKPRYTDKGNVRKNNEFLYPHKNEMLSLKKQLCNTDPLCKEDIDIISKQIHDFIILTNDEFNDIRRR